MTEEIWKDVVGYEGLYKVSNCGRVKSLLCKKEYILKPHLDRYGYQQVHLSRVGKSKTCRIHRLVAMAFIDNPMNKAQVNHIDGDRANNVLSNLEWCTAAENTQHSYRIGMAVPDYSKRYVFLYDKQGNFVRGFSSVNKACQWLGVSIMSLCGCCNGLVKEVNGYKAMFKGVGA